MVVMVWGRGSGVRTSITSFFAFNSEKWFCSNLNISY